MPGTALQKIVAPTTMAAFGIAALFFAPGATVTFESGVAKEAAAFWAVSVIVGLLLGIWIAREIHNRDQHRLTISLVQDALFRPEPTFDDRARALADGDEATVGLIQRRIQIDLGLQQIAAISFRDGDRDMNDRRAAKLVRVEIPGILGVKAADVTKQIRDAYSPQLETLDVWLFSTEGRYVHGNTRMKSLRGLIL